MWTLRMMWIMRRARAAIPEQKRRFYGHWTMSTIAPPWPLLQKQHFCSGKVFPSMDDEELTCLDHLWADTHPPAKLPTTAGEKSSLIFYLLSVFDGSQMWYTKRQLKSLDLELIFYMLLRVAIGCDIFVANSISWIFQSRKMSKNLRRQNLSDQILPQEKCQNCNKLNTEIERNWYKWLLP